MRWSLIGLALALLLYLSTAVYTVGTDQRALVRRFGRVIADYSNPGLHVGLPWGLDRVDLFKPSETKTVAVGVLGSADRLLGAAPSDTLAQFLAADQNLVNVQATVQYTISDPVRYSFGSADPARVVIRATESAITQTLAGKAIDSVLTTGKAELAVLIRQKLQKHLDTYQLGVAVRSVSLAELSPPPQVADAFTRAASARSDRERLKLEAQRYSLETLAQADAEARQAVNQATADHDRAIDRARSQADRFRAMLYEYRKNPAITATRLYLETVAEIIPRFKSKLIIDRGQGVDVTILREEQ